MAAEWDLLVRGGGPAGAAAALLLARRGWRVLLLEKCRAPGDRVCGEFLSPEALPVLARLGLSPALAAAGGAPIDTAAIVGSGGRQLQIPLPAPGLGLSRRRLDGLLLDAAEREGVAVRRGVLVTGFVAPGTHGYAALGPRGEVLARGRVVVDAAGKQAGAWGGAPCASDAQGRMRSPPMWSAAPSAASQSESAPGLSNGRRGATSSEKAVGGVALQSASHLDIGTDCGDAGPARTGDGGEESSSPGRRRSRGGWIGLKAHFRGTSAPSGTVALHSFPRGYCGTAPVEDGLLNVCLVAAEGRLRRARSPEALFDKVLAACPALAEQLAGAERVQPAFVCTAGLSYRAQAPRGPVPRIGDAAGLIAPLTGDGMAMALRAAELTLAPVEACLRGHLPLEALGHACRQALEAEFAARRGWGRALHELLIRPSAVAAAARMLGHAPAAGQFLFARTRGAATPG